MAYHEALSFSVSASDPQPGHVLALSATGLPSGLSLTDNGDGTGTVAGTVAAAPGTYPVTVTAGDGVSAPEQPMTITVAQAATTLAYAGASLIATDRPATLSAVLQEDGGSPPNPDGQTVTLTLGTDASAQSCQGQAGAAGTVAARSPWSTSPWASTPSRPPSLATTTT